MRPTPQLLLRLSSSGNRGTLLCIYAVRALQSTAHTDDACLGLWIKILHEILLFKMILKAKQKPLGLPKSHSKAKALKAKRTKKGHVPTLSFVPHLRRPIP